MAAKESLQNDPVSLLTARLTGVSIPKPRKSIPYNLWAKANQHIIDQEFKGRCAREKPVKQQRLTLLSKVTRELFDKTSHEEKQKWQDEVTRQYDTALAEWSKGLASPASTSPNDRQRCIEGLVAFAQPLLDVICECTGMKASLFVGGPEPADGGRLNVISMHSGSTTGSVHMNFGQAEGSGIKEIIIPIFGRFLKKCYTVEECRSRALPDQTSSKISLLVTDDQSVSLHHIDGDANGPDASPSISPSPSSSTTPETAPQPAAPGLDPVHIASPMQMPVPRPFLDSRGPRSHAPDPRSLSVSRSPSPGIALVSCAPTPGPSPSSNALIPGPTPTSRAPAPQPSPSSRAPTPRPPTSSCAPTQRSSPAVTAIPPRSSLATLMPITRLSPSAPSAPAPQALITTIPDQSSLATALPTPGLVPSALPSPPLVTTPSSLSHRPSHSTIAALPISGHVSTTSSLNAPISVPPSLPSPAVQSQISDSGKKRKGVDVVADRDSNAKRLKPDARSGNNIAKRLAEVGLHTRGKRRRVAFGGTTPDISEGSTSTSSSLSTLPEKFKLPSNAPAWMVSASAMLRSQEAFGDRWLLLVTSWERFEVQEGFASQGKLGKTRRPVCISSWIQRARSPNYRPSITDLDAFEGEFTAWWKSIQPDSRSDGGFWSNARSDGQPIRKAGINGLLSVIAALFFWRCALRSGDPVEPWEGAVEDVRQVFQALLQDEAKDGCAE